MLYRRLRRNGAASRHPGNGADHRHWRGEGRRQVGGDWLNLLAVGEASPNSATQGVYVGEALPPVPPKLTNRIEAWEFIEMASPGGPNRIMFIFSPLLIKF